MANSIAVAVNLENVVDTNIKNLINIAEKFCVVVLGPNLLLQDLRIFLLLLFMESRYWLIFFRVK